MVSLIVLAALASPRAARAAAPDSPAVDRVLKAHVDERWSVPRTAAAAGAKESDAAAQLEAERDAAMFGSATSDAGQPRDGAPAVGNAPYGASAPSAANSASSEATESAPDDPLRIGGQLYLSAYGTLLRGENLADAPFGAPALLDVYLDARPNERVRGFVLGRMGYDLSAGDYALNFDSRGISSAVASAKGSTSVSALSSAEGGARVLLDQLWLRFDLARRVFITAGKQHVRWGTGHFWIPTDYLHVSRKNPLNTFDTRPGTAMLKLHVPIESKSWNFYAYGVLENPTAAGMLGNVGGAARAEFAFGTTEFSLGAFVQRGQRPKFAADLSTGLGDVDLYGELAVLNASSIDRVRYDLDPILPDDPFPPPWLTPEEVQAIRFMQAVDLTYPSHRARGYRVQAVGGLSYALKYNDKDSLTVGAEYFYNQLGYGDARVYPGLFLPRLTPLQDPASFFYLGRHYGALSVAFPAPFSLDLHSFRVSTLGNLSDGSYITRLDYSLTLLTHLVFEAFASVRYGKSRGEFRLGIAPMTFGGITVSVPPTLADVGVALRVSI